MKVTTEQFDRAVAAVAEHLRDCVERHTKAQHALDQGPKFVASTPVAWETKLTSITAAWADNLARNASIAVVSEVLTALGVHGLEDE